MKSLQDLSKEELMQKAYELRNSGISFGKISTILGIGKTTAYDYFKIVSEQFVNPNFSQSSAKKSNAFKKQTSKEVKISPLKKRIELPSINKSKIKVFTGDELLKVEFESLEFFGKFQELIGKPSLKFSAIIWGKPKGGKSNLSVRLADYIQEYFGDVLYVSSEEGECLTFQEKIRDIGGSKMTVAETKGKDEIREFIKSSNYKFVFLDSINAAGIDSEYLEIIKNENPDKSFIAIVQATKGGNFKGDQSLTHNCDFIIKVIDGIAYQSGRFNTASEISIFDQPLYNKNPNPRKVQYGKPKLQIEESPLPNLGELLIKLNEKAGIKPNTINQSHIESVANQLRKKHLENQNVESIKQPEMPIKTKATNTDLLNATAIGTGLALARWLFSNRQINSNNSNLDKA